MVYSLFLRRNYHLWEFPVEIYGLVSDIIFAIGQLRYVVTAFGKSFAIHANAYEFMEESNNENMHKTAVLIDIGRTEQCKLHLQ